MNVTSFNIKLGILVATAGIFADAMAGPPEKRPLVAQRDGRHAAAAAPGDAPTAQQLFYYSDGRKIYLNETGLAVAKPKPNAAIDDVKARPVRSAPQDEQLASLINAAEVGGLQVVSMENPEALRMALHDAPQEVEFVLPIVEPEQKRTSAEPAPKRTYLMMTPYIAARFVPEADAQKLIADTGLKVAKKQEHVPGGYILELAGGPIEYDRLIQAANSLYEKGKQSGEVVYAHPDFIPARTRQQINDPGFADQWHLSNTGGSGALTDADIDALEAWAVTEGDASIIVAIIDDSVQRNHPDLAANYRTGRYYRGLPLGETDDPSPKTGDEQHGTACAGVAVSVGNDIGIRGSAPNCGLIGVHFWHATAAQTAEAFYFAMDPDKNPETNDGASVISCSWGWNGAFDAVSGAVSHVAANGRKGRGIPILFAAANDAGPIGTHQWFCGMDGVICVGATDWRDNRSWYSNFGGQLDVVAPSSGSGGALRINTTDNTDDMPKAPGFGYSGYATGEYTGAGIDGFGGTSSATPLTAGVAALILSANPELSATDVRTILEHTADRVRGSGVPAQYDPALGHDINYGFGRVNAKRAVHVARQGVWDEGAIWPDRVCELMATPSGPNVRINWKNPARAAGVLVVRSDYRLAWRPHDRDRFDVGDTLQGGVGRVVSVDLREQFEEPIVGDGPRFYTVFTYNDDFSYSWGETVELVAPLSDSQAVASGGS